LPKLLNLGDFQIEGDFMFKKEMLIVALSCLVFIACDDDSSANNDNNVNNVNNANNSSNLCGNFTIDAAEVCDGTAFGTATCEEIHEDLTGGELVCNDTCSEVASDLCSGDGQDVIVNIHSGDVYVRLIDYENSQANADVSVNNCDIVVSHDEFGPQFKLCRPGTSVYVLGNDIPFNEVLEAPLDATYITDDGTDYAISSDHENPDSFKDGGVGEDPEGYDMTENIYILSLGDGSYAKMEVLSAAGGTIKTKFYRDPRGGSNLRTTIPSK
jgi:hypothetical protein